MEKSLAVSNLMCTFAMTKRRERAKAQGQQLNQQLVRCEVKSKEHPVAKKMADLCFDVAKLIIGGVVLAGLMKQEIDYLFLLTTATIAISIFLGLAVYLIEYSEKK